MAKAFEWANKFSKTTECETLLNEYKVETEELINNRTKNSKDEYKKAAKEGAIREQRQKFIAICNRVDGLQVQMFDEVMAVKPPKQEKVSEDLPRTELVSV